MGVKGLLKLTQCVSNIKVNWLNFKNCIFCVDLACWLINPRLNSSEIISNILVKIQYLIASGIKLIFVIDGAPPIQKFNCLIKRNVPGTFKKRSNEEIYKNSHFRKLIDKVIKLLEYLSIPFISLKKGEAESVCAVLEQRLESISGVISNDSDC